MMIDQELLDILACPFDKKGNLIYDEENQKLICRECGRRYNIHNGIPVMLIEEAERPDGGKDEEKDEG